MCLLYRRWLCPYISCAELKACQTSIRLSSAYDAERLQNAQVLSSFEIYKKEVLSGSLDWTPMHTSVRGPSG